MSSNWEKLKNKSKTKSTTTQKQKFRPNVLSKQKANDKKSRKRLREEISQVSIPSNDSSSNKKRKKKKKKKKHNSSSSTSSSLSSTANTATSNELSRTLTKAPNPFRVSRSNTYLQPNDSQFHQVSRQSYRGLVFDTPAALPSSLHQRVASALESMRQSELFHRDVVATGRSVSATFVERTLVGNPGMTYYYQRLRIFAFPWDDAHCLPNSPLLIIRELNDTLKKSTKYHLKKDKTPIKGSCDFNISLINYMQSQNAANKSKVPLKKEGIFGLGDASVSWHADSSLKNFSSIAVYHQTGDSQGTSWSVASRVIGDDVTPAIKVPLKDRQTYYMLNDFNHHHHHAVLSGNTWRYSSTHRVAVTSKDTWEFAWKVCEDGKKAYEKIMDQVNKKKELDPILMRVAAESHLTIEFDWIRMYYIQGQKHADSHHGYWQPRMNQLLERWSYYERSLPIIAGYLVEMESDLGSKNQRSKRMFIWLLDEQIEKRRDYRKRCRSSAYFTLETEERPMELPASDTSIKATELRAALV